MAGLLYPASIMPADYVPTGASSVVATYAAARTIPLAVITLGAIFKRSASALLTLGIRHHSRHLDRSARSGYRPYRPDAGFGYLVRFDLIGISVMSRRSLRALGTKATCS